MKPLLLALSLVFLAATAAAQDAPNIVFFFVDDMGSQDTSVPFHSERTALNDAYRTPNMERFARKGLRFTNAYACAICSPSRVSLMTGQNAARHGVTCWTLHKDTSPETPNDTFGPADWPVNGLQPFGSDIPRSVAAITLPQRLREAGYRTIHAGKAHFGASETPGADPRNLGFDINIAGCHIGGPGSYYGDHNFSAVSRGGDHTWDVPGLDKYHGEEINLTEAITREAVAALEASVADEQPFYLYLSHYTVHAPFQPDRRFIANYADEPWSEHQKVYASMLEGMDASFGDILNALDRLDVADNTIVVFMSDNGSPATHPQNLPLRGHKIHGYEGGSRVPLIAFWPGQTPANALTDTPVIIEDIYPTLLELAGLDVTERIDGVSFKEVLTAPDTDRSARPLFWHYPNLYYRPAHSSVRLGDHKLIYWHTTQTLELFDLAADIGETTNLADNQPERTQRLAKLLTAHLRETGASMLIRKDTGAPVPYPDGTRRVVEGR